MKLPAFYLLDSICKNVYQEYAHRFAPMVTNMFLDAYRSVDHATQAKMEEMLVTWRNGAPGGRELFGVTPQIDIERIVFSGHGAVSMVVTSSKHARSTLLIRDHRDLNFTPRHQFPRSKCWLSSRLPLPTRNDFFNPIPMTSLPCSRSTRCSRYVVISPPKFQAHCLLTVAQHGSIYGYRTSRSCGDSSAARFTRDAAAAACCTSCPSRAECVSWA